MQDLTEIRNEINEIDQQMANLYERRMNLSKEVARYKYQHRLPILDLIREKEVIKDNSELIESDDLKESYEEFISFLMDQSKSIQQEFISKIHFNGDIPF